MTRTKAKRRRKHRGTQAGTVQRPPETRGRGASGRAGAPRDKAAARETARRRRTERMDRPPTWRSSAIRAGLAAVFVAVVLIVIGNPPAQALLLAVIALVVYVPLGYAFDTFVYRLRQRRKGGRAKPSAGAGKGSSEGHGGRRGRSRGEG
jgi:hypothetical protein